MKSKYRLFERKNDYYFCEDRETGHQESLRTKSKDDAIRLINAKNEAHQSPGLSLHLARVFPSNSDPSLSKRTWRSACEDLIKTKQGESAARWGRAIKDPAFKSILVDQYNEALASRKLAKTPMRRPDYDGRKRDS